MKSVTVCCARTGCAASAPTTTSAKADNAPPSPRAIHRRLITATMPASTRSRTDAILFIAFPPRFVAVRRLNGKRPPSIHCSDGFDFDLQVRQREARHFDDCAGGTVLREILHAYRCDLVE